MKILQNDKNRLDASIFGAVKNGLINNNRQECVTLNSIGLWQSAYSEKLCLNAGWPIVVKACTIWREVRAEKALLSKFEHARGENTRERYAERIADKVAARITREFFVRKDWPI
jgi:hypothetical protein